MKKLLIISLLILFCFPVLAKPFKNEILNLKDKLSNGNEIEITARKMKVTGTFAIFYYGGRDNEIESESSFFINSIKIRIGQIIETFVPMSALSNLYNPTDISYIEGNDNQIEIIIKGDESGTSDLESGTEYTAMIYFQFKKGAYNLIKREWVMTECPEAKEITLYSFCHPFNEK
jgi:hypothetical protein